MGGGGGGGRGVALTSSCCSLAALRMRPLSLASSSSCRWGQGAWGQVRDEGKRSAVIGCWLMRKATRMAPHRSAVRGGGAELGIQRLAGRPQLSRPRGKAAASPCLAHDPAPGCPWVSPAYACAPKPAASGAAAAGLVVTHEGEGAGRPPSPTTTSASSAAALPQRLRGTPCSGIAAHGSAACWQRMWRCARAWHGMAWHGGACCRPARAHHHVHTRRGHACGQAWDGPVRSHMHTRRNPWGDERQEYQESAAGQNPTLQLRSRDPGSG